MSVAPSILLPTATGSDALNQRLTRGGVACAILSATAGGTWWVAPQDAARRYIAFSLDPAFLSAVVTPGDDNAPAGYYLSQTQPDREFGGNALREIVSSGWWLTTTGACIVNVVVIRDT